MTTTEPATTTVDYGDYDDDGPPVFLCDAVNFSTIDGAAYIIILIVSVICNTLLLFVLLRYENLKNVTDFFVLNLACADLLFTVTLGFWAVNELHRWVFGDFACKFLTTMYFAGEYCSVMLLTAMTADRFKTVALQKWTNRGRRQRCAKLACVSAWLVGIGGSLVDAFKVEVRDSQCVTVSDESLSFYLQVSLLFFLPLVIIVVCYAAILKKVLQPANRKRTRTVVVVFVIVMVFFVCWGPYNILLLTWELYDPQGCKAERRLTIAFHVCRMLAYAHCFMNPLLYMHTQRQRGHLWRLLHCHRLRRKSGDKSTAMSVIQNPAFLSQNSSMMQ